MKKPQRKLATPRKTAPKKRSRVKTDALRAFQLVCALIVVSICISFAVIIVYNTTSERARKSIDDSILNVEGTEESNLNEEGKAALVQPTVRSENEPALEPVTPTPTPAPAATQTPIAANTTVRPSIPATTIRSAEKTGNIAFVIDDAGNNLQELDAFLRIEGPLTIAVLPGLPHSAEAARRIRAAGKEVILHQPMESVGGQNPGPGAIYSNMNAQQIRAILAKNIEEVGPVAGMNNHQGSKITMDREIMEVILAFCVERNIYFLDSRTTAETAVPAAARRLGMNIAERDTFLDNEQDKESMQRYLTSGLARAQRNGVSVMIGHTHSRALAPLLSEQYPVLTIQGYTIKTVSDLLK